MVDTLTSSFEYHCSLRSVHISYSILFKLEHDISKLEISKRRCIQMRDILLGQVGAIDSDAHKNTGGEYGVKGFPTIKASIEFQGQVQGVRGISTYTDLIQPKRHTADA